MQLKQLWGVNSYQASRCNSIVLISVILKTRLAVRKKVFFQVTLEESSNKNLQNFIFLYGVILKVPSINYVNLIEPGLASVPNCGRIRPMWPNWTLTWPRDFYFFGHFFSRPKWPNLAISLKFFIFLVFSKNFGYFFKKIDFF